MKDFGSFSPNEARKDQTAFLPSMLMQILGLLFGILLQQGPTLTFPAHPIPYSQVCAGSIARC